MRRGTNHRGLDGRFARLPEAIFTEEQVRLIAIIADNRITEAIHAERSRIEQMRYAKPKPWQNDKPTTWWSKLWRAIR